ncbi:MAG: ABC transporter permease [Planctomycetota bacterium]
MRSIVSILGTMLWFIPNRLSSLGNNVGTAFVQVWANKIRSFLTVLGIIIAVTSIITVVSFVRGFGDYFTGFLRGLGTNMMVVYPEAVRGSRNEVLSRAELHVEDMYAVDAFAPAVRRTAPLIFHRGNVEYGRQQAQDVLLRGSSELFQPIRNYYVDAGRFFTAIDVENAAQVCVLGREVLRKLECDESVVGDFVHLDSQRFKVVGLFETKGSFMGENQDDLVVIPWTTALKMYPHFREYMAFYVEAVKEDKVPEAEAQVVAILRQRHGLKPEQRNDFGFFKQDEMLKEFHKVEKVATGILGGIVSISLLVGGIGIMNVMLVSVTERTREIGLRKSVGARRRDILSQFLTEAVVLSTIGGAIGIGLGYAIGFVASMHPSMVPVKVPIWSVALALGFSAGVGIFFGIIPAFKAAILHPIDALRHE